MSLRIDLKLTARALAPAAKRLFELSATKIDRLEGRWDASRGTPVFTVKGRYTSRGWTEWTQGFQYGAALLQYEATGDRWFLELGRSRTVERMAPHLTHMGVHDHGFNNVSTYGNLLRLMRGGLIEANPREADFYELALKVSGAVQAARWTGLGHGAGYIYSFNGPHSLFVDTLRSLRSLAVAWKLGHVLMGEKDRRIDLLGRLIAHARTTAQYVIFNGEGRDAYDTRGRTVHEAVFNTNDGSFRCPSSQQGFSPFTTWTRGLAWAICGYAEELEFLETLEPAVFEPYGGKKKVLGDFLKPALATADFYLANMPTCGVPYWDTGAPNLHRLTKPLDKPADPYNAWEPVDSSAAAIAAQGLLRLGSYLGSKAEARKYTQAGLTIARTLFAEPYLSTNARHEGLLLHSVYHRPNGWDHVAEGQKVPNGESSMWGDYHARELGVMILRAAEGKPYQRFFDGVGPATA